MRLDGIDAFLTASSCNAFKIDCIPET